MSSSIQFSYPQMSIEQVTNTNNTQNFKINAGGGSYFDLYYNNTVLHFIPSEISFIQGDTQYMIINHNHSSTTNSLIIRFKIVESDDAKTGITEKNIYINKLIGDGLEGGKLKFDTNVSIKTKTSGGTDYVIDFGDCGPLTIKKLKEDIKNGGTWPTTVFNTGNTIALKPNSFATDEIVCDEGTINSVADKTKKSYEAKVAGNIGISFGVGFLFLTIIFWLITQFKDNYLISRPFELFKTAPAPAGAGTGQLYYNIAFVIAFIISIVCFITYGVRMKMGPTSTKDNYVSSLLASAIIFFLIFIFMVGYKMLVLTV